MAGIILSKVSNVLPLPFALPLTYYLSVYHRFSVFKEIKFHLIRSKTTVVKRAENEKDSTGEKATRIKGL